MTTPKTEAGLPRGWTDLAHGMTLQQVANLFDALAQLGEVTVYRDGKPVAVLLTIDEYHRVADS